MVSSLVFVANDPNPLRGVLHEREGFRFLPSAKKTSGVIRRRLGPRAVHPGIPVASQR